MTAGVSGPRRALPDLRLHQLFEQAVVAHPTAVAAEHADEAWTYAELNARVNRLARALVARGVASEDMVGVVMARNLDWMAALLAVLKAGGVYLPIEPHFPADRVAAMLTRAECRIVLTEAGSAAELDQAICSVPHPLDVLPVETVHQARCTEDGNVDVEVTPDQLAYVFFTSGSTGEPKGATCEHAGMLNHLLAKVDDLGLADRRTVVAQTAPQCFDISLWQLLAPILVGGRTRIVDQATILDAERFLDEVVAARVTVLQVVPSYLDAVLTQLERHPRDLPDLRCVSVTGEAVTEELTVRWFAAQPDIAMVNAYGLTETSDDTNHHVMTRPPDGDRVPLGAPVRNVRVYVVDEDLQPVPHGTEGEIVLAGVCVGRGYVNDPERTRLAFVADPHVPGERWYRSGDRGRLLADGTLEFLGRSDCQVKVRGHRIEIGEVEGAVSAVPGVRLAAVVVAAGPDRDPRLVAFYSAARPQDASALREGVGRSLPPYMVPAAFHWLEALPLTANAKVDRAALTALAADLGSVDPGHETPRTPSEKRVASAFADVLGIPLREVGRHDSFFDRGGTSLSAVKLVVALDRAVSLQTLTRNPVLADLAPLVASAASQRKGARHA